MKFLVFFSLFTLLGYCAMGQDIEDHDSGKPNTVELAKYSRAFLKAKIATAINANQIAELPAGEYVLDRKLTFEFRKPAHVKIQGTPGKTIIRLVDGAVHSRWSGALQFTTRSKEAAHSTFTIDGVTFSTNASGNPITNGNRYQYEQAAGLKVLGSWSNISITNCSSYDCVADGIHIGGDYVGEVNIKNITGRDRHRSRACLAITFDRWNLIKLENIDVVFFDFEPNNVSQKGTANRVEVDDMKVQRADFSGRGELTVNRLKVTEQLSVGNFNSHFKDFDVELVKPVRFVKGRHELTDGKFTVQPTYRGTTKWVKSLIYSSGKRYSSQTGRLRFEDVEFISGPNKNPLFTFAAYARVDEYVEFKNCTSDFELIDRSRPGDYRIDQR